MGKQSCKGERDKAGAFNQQLKELESQVNTLIILAIPIAISLIDIMVIKPNLIEIL